MPIEIKNIASKIKKKAPLTNDEEVAYKKFLTEMSSSFGGLDLKLSSNQKILYDHAVKNVMEGNSPTAEEKLAYEKALSELRVKFSFSSKVKLTEDEIELYNQAVKNVIDGIYPESEEQKNLYISLSLKIERKINSGFAFEKNNLVEEHSQFSKDEEILFNTAVRNTIDKMVELENSSQQNEMHRIQENAYKLYDLAKDISPFAGKVRYYEEEEDVSGAQKKAEHSGRYWDEYKAKFFYIKKSEKHPGDDIAEVYGSKLSQVLINESVADCSFVKNEQKDVMYIASEFYTGFEPLYKHKRWAFDKKTSDFNRKFKKSDLNSPDPSTEQHPLAQSINSLKNHEVHELCSVLATSLLYRGYDVQTENINFYLDENGDRHVGRIDFGWMLDDIALDPKVRLLSNRNIAVAPWVRTKPTNHYREYFIFDVVQEVLPVQLEKIAMNAQNKIDQLLAEMENCLKNIGNSVVLMYKEFYQAESLYNLAKHIGMQEWGVPFLDELMPLSGKLGLKFDHVDEAIVERLKECVHSTLRDNIISRSQQMHCIAQCINYQNAVKEDPNNKYEHGVKLLADLLDTDDFERIINKFKKDGAKFVDFNKNSGDDYPELVLNEKFILDLASEYENMAGHERKTLTIFVAEFCDDKALLKKIKAKNQELYENIKDPNTRKINFNKYDNELSNDDVTVTNDIEKDAKVIKYIEYLLSNKFDENEDEDKIDLQNSLQNIIVLNDYSSQDQNYYKKILNTFKEYAIERSEVDDWDEELDALYDDARQHFLIDKKKLEYTKLILKSINDNISLSSLTLAKHAEVQKIFNKLVADGTLTKTSEPENFILAVYELKKEDIKVFEKAINEYKSPKNVLLKNTIMLSPNKTQLATNKSYQEFVSPPPLGLSTNVKNNVNIENKLQDSLNFLKKIKKLTCFSPPKQVELSSGDIYYETTVTNKNKNDTKIRLAKNGEKAYIAGTYDEESYRALVEVYVRTHKITDPKKVTPLNIPDNHKDSVNEIINDMVNEYLLEIGEKKPILNDDLNPNSTVP